MNTLRPNKEATINAAISLAPEYIKIFRDLQKGDGRLIFRPEVAAAQNRFASAYVPLYDNELKLGVALMVALLGEEEYRELNSKLNDAPPEQQQQFLNDIAEERNWDEIAEAFQIPDTPQGWEFARKQLESLPPDERREIEKRGALYWLYFFGSFFNLLALIVHGEKLTALVPKAINGDDTAFMRAVQTDRMLLHHHPYFIERKLRAVNEGDRKFLIRLASREATPILNGQVQFPGLYMVFGILESFRWLDDMKASEILDICINAGLDQYQNRIDDVNYLSTRLREYRKWQNTLRMSRI